MSDDNGSSRDGTAICNMFGLFFASINPPDISSNVLDHVGDDRAETCFKLQIKHEDLLQKLKCLDDSKGAGPDGISPFFIKRCSECLVIPLLTIFNNSLSTEVFPKHWKIAKVVPIFKNGDNTSVKNYRPISVLSTFGKVLESMVCSVMQSHFKQYISLHQHGFVQARSTCTNLVTFTEDVIEAMDSGKQVHVIYTDFRKAFDMVSHNVLVLKLAMYGFSGTFLKWIESYLRDRSFFVVANGYESSRYTITSGVP